MTDVTPKIAVFIDGANLYATAKALGFDIDYKKLLKELQSRGNLLRAFYYTAIFEDQEYSSIRPLVDWLDYNGYTAVTKLSKEYPRRFRPPQGESVRQDIGLAVDAMELRVLCRRNHPVHGRRRFPPTGGGATAPWRPRHGRFDRSVSAADDRR